MNWIRVSVALGDDPKVHRMADALGCRVAEAAGLLILLLSRFPEHAPDGDLNEIPATLVERWALWEGERGAFDAVFRATFLSQSGVWVAWDKHNGNALKKLERDRERLRERRDRVADATVAGLSRDGRAVVAGTDGRTDEVQERGRSRARNGNGTHPPAPVPYAEAKPFAPAFCDHCEGIPVTTEKGRITGRVHAGDCPRRAE